MSDRGTPPAGDRAHAEPVLIYQHDELHNSATNPRRHFSETKQRELAENIIALVRQALKEGTQDLGVKTPLFVRASLDQPGKMEIIAGESRWRATELAQEIVQEDPDAPFVIERLRQMPVLVKSWNDRQVVEFQLIENLRRADLTPMEEADGYVRMIKMGNSPEGIADKVGTRIAEVYRALKWARLPDLARQAFELGLCGKEHATLIARIPDEMARRCATLELIYFPDHEYDSTDVEQGEADALLTLRDEPEAIEAMPVKAAREHVMERYMSSLSDATFALEDATLMPVRVDSNGERVCGGDCESCLFRTGKNPLFQAEVAAAKEGSEHGRSRGMDPNVCTKPSCKREKTELQWQRDSAEAQLAGYKVMGAAEVAKVFYPKSGTLIHGVDFVDINDKPDYTLVGHANDGKAKAWSRLLKGADVPLVLAQDPTGRTRKLVVRKLAIEAAQRVAEESGKDSPFVATNDSGNDRFKEQQKKAAEEEKRDQRAFCIALAELTKRLTETPPGLEEWQKLINPALRSVGIDGLRYMARALGVEPEKPKAGEGHQTGHFITALEAHFLTGATVPSLQACMVVCTVAGMAHYSLLGSDVLKTVCGIAGVSLVEAKQLAKDEAKAKQKGAAKKAAKKAPAKVPDGMESGKTLSGAPAETVYVASAEENPQSELGLDVGGKPAVRPGSPLDKLRKQLLKNGRATQEDIDDPDCGDFQALAARARANDHAKLEALEKEWAELKKPTKADGEAALKAWDAARGRLKRAFQKLGAKPPAK